MRQSVLSQIQNVIKLVAFYFCRLLTIGLEALIGLGSIYCLFGTIPFFLKYLKTPYDADKSVAYFYFPLVASMILITSGLAGTLLSLLSITRLIKNIAVLGINHPVVFSHAIQTELNQLVSSVAAKERLQQDPQRGCLSRHSQHPDGTVSDFLERGYASASRKKSR